jgi:predicted transposase YbfD/YdcC
MLKHIFQSLKDHRSKQGQRYDLHHTLLFSIFAMLSNATSYRKIHSFISIHFETLKELCDLSWKRAPAYTTIRNIIQGLSPEEAEKAVRTATLQMSTAPADAQRFISCDGKTLRQSVDAFEDQHAAQLLSVFAQEESLILAHLDLSQKPNEIPLVQQLLLDSGLTNCVFTVDALHCQEDTLKAAKDSPNEVIVQVKANQPNLLKDCQRTAETSQAEDVYQEPVTKAHGRIESRKVEVFPDFTLTDPMKWDDSIQSMVKVSRTRLIFDTKTKAWKDTSETSWYISTTVLDAETCCRGIRQHWGVENRNHYVRDVTLQEDASRIRINPTIFARLRSLTLNILRINKVTNICKELYENSLKFDRLFRYPELGLEN